MSKSELEEKMFKALNVAYFRAKNDNQNTDLVWADADIYLHFSWPGSSPNASDIWKPYPSNIQINHVLFGLNEKKSFLEKMIMRQNWLEKKVANDYRYYQYYSDTGIFESVFEGKLIKVLFNGRILKENEHIQHNFLRVWVSRKLFILYFRDILFK
ncbi:MAG: hypothetical protein LAT84_14345 [Balneolia bacterium]|nr:hypothetical protein [Balneolia bacterium]